MTLIEKYREAIVILDMAIHSGWHNDEQSNAIGFFFELEEKIIPKFSKGDMVKVKELGLVEYEVVICYFDFEEGEQRCLIENQKWGIRAIEKSSNLERINNDTK